jgi:hypothetical protein
MTIVRLNQSLLKSPRVPQNKLISKKLQSRELEKVKKTKELLKKRNQLTMQM